ncbi:GNAT family N-acetyltransferase [Salimicrobium halophilum]|uniref:Acetyltransferase (GNAT) domain-containing protein n=1 Tax=Salimicrobium halophilum TaxID=86666 RepID=A0A1G8R8V1_9BACI|nr:GNAT family protein [Salimicrobium halophilum]SDJ12810.1 Acetyltransferase (GNAT) domain-containing protein [Salimicrobium halophilum]
MKEIHGKKVMLKEATEKDIHETKVTKAEYHREWSDEGILPEVPSALIIEADQQLIGYVGAYWIDKNTNWLETGIVIYDSDYWNGGYGSEAYKLWIDYLFEATTLHRVGMSTWSGNDRMIKVAQKLGMKEEARIRRAREVDNRYYDAVKMGILREEWDGGS